MRADERPFCGRRPTPGSDDDAATRREPRSDPLPVGPGAPAFDRYGNANYDSSGTYIGGHGVGTLVDNPDIPKPQQTPSDIVKSDQQNIDNAMCKEIKAGDPNAAC